MAKERRYSKEAGTVVCHIECMARKACPAPKENKCRQAWEASREEAAKNDPSYPEWITEVE